MKKSLTSGLSGMGAMVI